MESGGFVPKHRQAASAPTGPTRPGWALPLLVSMMALGTAGVGLTHTGDRSASGPPTTAGSERANGDDDLNVCIRASLEDRVGLLLVVGIPGVTTADHPLVDQLVEVGVAGVMLRDDNIEGEAQTVELIQGLRQRLGDDLLVAVDDEGGRVTSMRALDQPVRSARRLGQADPETVREFGLDLGQRAASVGIDWVLAPVADLDDGPADGVIGDRSFGGDPTEVAVAASAFADGLHDAGVAVTAKHFPGHGGEGDPHTGRTVDPSTLAELERGDLVAFRRLVAEGAEATMVGHVTYPAVWGDVPASLAPGAYELLRAQGFSGVAITDALGMGAIHSQHGFDVAPAMAIGAGADAVLVNQGGSVLVLRDGLVAAVRDGRLDEARVDEAVRRVLTLRGQDPDGVVCTGP